MTTLECKNELLSKPGEVGEVEIGIFGVGIDLEQSSSIKPNQANEIFLFSLSACMFACCLSD